MKIDKFGNYLYEEKDILSLIYQDKEEYLSKILCTSEINIPFIKKIDPTIYEISIDKYDSVCQDEWLMPDEYKDLDIIQWVMNQIPPWDERNDRLLDEIKEFESRNMINLLRWLKYIVDTCKKNNIVWGVGRGSSVSSYVLYLIGVHKIDPIKYNLDYKEFLR